MIHYHGLPITPATAAVKAISGGHAFVSFRHPNQLSLAIEICQSFAVDNGAFSAWKSGSPIVDWSHYYKWVDSIKNCPNFDFAVIPDVIDGSEGDNDRLIRDWPFSNPVGAPVWHMHESLERLKALADMFYRVCIGSSGQFAVVGDNKWFARMSEAMDAVCDENGLPICKLHGLRMLNPAIFTQFPLASADSTNIGQNIGIDSAWRGTYSPINKEARAMVMRERIEAQQSALRWISNPSQQQVFQLAQHTQDNRQ
jgi:hypothetical protein